MFSRLLRAFFQQAPASHGNGRLARWWNRRKRRTWYVMMVMHRVGMSSTMVMMMVMYRSIHKCTWLRCLARLESNRVERARRDVFRWLMVVVMMMVRMRMHVVVLMCGMVCFCSFRSRLMIRSVPAIQSIFLLSCPSSILLPAINFRRAPPFNLRHRSPDQITAFYLADRRQSSWCRGAVGLPCGWCRSAHATAQTREHSPEFHLYARIVTARADVSRLRSLHRLRQR